MSSRLNENLLAVREQIVDAAEKSGRTPAEVKLLAVSKTFPAGDIRAVFDCGQVDFGENRVQELETKVPALPPEICWHLIGHLQSNKAEKAVALADFIHSVDSVKLAGKINSAAEKQGKTQKILLEVNVSGEKSKFGISGYDALCAVMEKVLPLEHIKLFGLMTMAPLDADEFTLHDTFGGLRTFRDRLQKEFRITLPELSMGMSGDFRTAIEEGATIVRIGSAIFGGRTYPV